MVWEVYEGIEVKDRSNQETGFWCNVGHGKSSLSRVGFRVEVINHPQEEQDIMCGGGSGYSVLWSLMGGGIFPHTIKGDVEVLGRCQTKEGVITRDGDP